MVDSCSKSTSPNPEGGRLLRGDGDYGPLSPLRLRPRSRRLHSNYQVYEHDPKQFALIQMNMGREVT
jgi:hypothetical protein